MGNILQTQLTQKSSEPEYDVKLTFTFAENPSFVLIRQKDYSLPFSQENSLELISGKFYDIQVVDLIHVLRDIQYIPNTFLNEDAFEDNRKRMLKRALLMLATIRNLNIPD